MFGGGKKKSGNDDADGSTSKRRTSITESFRAAASKAATSARTSIGKAGAKMSQRLESLSAKMRSVVDNANAGVERLKEIGDKFKKATSEAGRAEAELQVIDAAAELLIKTASNSGEVLSDAQQKEIRNAMMRAAGKGGVAAVQEIASSTVRQSVNLTTGFDIGGSSATAAQYSGAMMAEEVADDVPMAVAVQMPAASQAAPAAGQKPSLAARPVPVPKKSGEVTISQAAPAAGQKPPLGARPAPAPKKSGEVTVSQAAPVVVGQKPPLPVRPSSTRSGAAQEETAAAKWARVTKRPEGEYPGNKISGGLGGVQLQKAPAEEEQTAGASAAKPAVTGMFAEMQAKQAAGLKKADAPKNAAVKAVDPNSIMAILAAKMQGMGNLSGYDSDDSKHGRDSSNSF